MGSGSPVKILVTGAKGQLGMELKSLGRNPEYEFIFSDLPDLDLTDRPSVRRFFESNKPGYCINCAAYTAVDKAETEKDAAFRVNVTAVENLGLACAEFGTRMIHISTDFVFPGQSVMPLREQDPTGPLNHYGLTKLEGEKVALKHCPQVIILRTSWLYCPYGQNFVKTILQAVRVKDSLKVVYDQIGTPTYAGDLADAIMTIVPGIADGQFQLDSVCGIYHYSNEGVASWYDFAKAILEFRGIHTPVIPVLTSQYPTLARRPPFSVLDKSRIKNTFGLTIPHWRDSLLKCLSLIE